MELSSSIRIKHPIINMDMVCTYYNKWNNIPLYITESYESVCSILHEDSSCLIVIGNKLLDLFSGDILEATLWHEVSHLYFKDSIGQLDIKNEYRADLVAACITSISTVIESLELYKVFFNRGESATIDKRIHNLLSVSNDVDISPFTMATELVPVDVRY